MSGNDQTNSSYPASGVKGHFYYQNNQLFGLDDDTPDVVMNSTDGLADVSSHLIQNIGLCNFQLTHINYPNQNKISTSANFAYFLTYTHLAPKSMQLFLMTPPCARVGKCNFPPQVVLRQVQQLLPMVFIFIRRFLV